MTFSAFLDKMQKMFNIFDEENKVILEQARVPMLLRKVEHPQLQDAVGALRLRASMDGITFIECANHLLAQASELADNQSARKISGSSLIAAKNPRGSAEEAPAAGILKTPDRSIEAYTCRMEASGRAFIPTGRRCRVTTSTRLSSTLERRTRKRESPYTKAGRHASEVGTKIKDIKSQMAELKRTIASLFKSKTADANGGESDTPDNASDAFGGRQQKKQRKE